MSLNKWEFYKVLKKQVVLVECLIRLKHLKKYFLSKNKSLAVFWCLFFGFFLFFCVFFWGHFVMEKLVFDCWSWIFLKWIVSRVWNNAYGLWPNFFRIHLIRGQQMMARFLLFSYNPQAMNVTFLMGFSQLKNWRIYSRDNMWPQNIQYLLYYP